VKRVIPTLRAAGVVASFLLLQGACRATGGPPGRTPRLDPPRCAPGETDLPAVVALARQSIVSVVAGHAAPGRVFQEPSANGREHAIGSGLVLREDGLVLTSRHVITGADDVRVELEDGRDFHAVVAAQDAWLDVALLRLEGASGLRPATLGSSDATSVGAPVLVMGNPFGIGPSVSRGILSAKGRAVDQGPAEIYLQTDAAVNPGNSGGPLLDAEGRVIGVTSAILEHGQGVSFAVPIDDVRAALPDLLAWGRVRRGYAGVSYQNVDAAVARALSMPAPEGAIVTSVEGGGPAAGAGLRAGDVILAVEDRAVQHASDLAHLLGRCRPGARVPLTVLRERRRHSLSLTLGLEREGPAGEGITATRSARKLGLHAGDAAGGGASIEAVDADGRAADDLHPGDVVVEANRRPVRSAAELTEHLSRAERPSTVLLRVRREGMFLYVGVDLE
jgi:serine protease Do